MGKIDDSTWRGILDHVRTLGNGVSRPWFAELLPEQVSGGVLEISVSTDDQRIYLTDHCRELFTQAAQAATGRLISVEFILREPHGEAPAGALTSASSAGSPGAESDEPLPLNAEYTFENFVTGPGNRLAHAAAVAVGDSPGEAYNPLFVHGSVGLGKTHLLQAACQRIRGRCPDKRMVYLSCEAFTNQFIEAVEKGALQSFRYRYRRVDVLAVDDVQFLSGKERTQEELFHTFNTLYQMQRQIILSADRSPKEIPSLEDRLISRFTWGLVTRIDQPCFETRLAIVRKKARARQMNLPDNVATLIASRIESNTRELEGAIVKLEALRQEHGSGITEALTLQALGEAVVGTATDLQLPDIVATVTQRYPVKLTELQGKRRNRSVALPRQICMYLARELTPLSLEQIGGYFGGRDHTTVLHAHRSIGRHRERDPQLAQTLDELKRTLQGH